MMPSGNGSSQMSPLLIWRSLRLVQLSPARSPRCRCCTCLWSLGRLCSRTLRSPHTWTHHIVGFAWLPAASSLRAPWQNMSSRYTGSVLLNIAPKSCAEHKGSGHNQSPHRSRGVGWHASKSSFAMLITVWASVPLVHAKNAKRNSEPFASFLQPRPNHQHGSAGVRPPGIDTVAHGGNKLSLIHI